MFFRKKGNRIDWPYLVFIPIAFGIILATLIVVLRLINVSSAGVNIGNAEKFKIEAEAMQKKVVEEYKKNLQDLAYQLFQSKDFSSSFAKVESIFFTIHVPQEHLDKHLKAWLAISALKEGGQNKAELGKIVDKLIIEAK